MTPDSKRAYPEDCELLREEMRKIKDNPAFRKSVETARKAIAQQGIIRKKDSEKQ